MKPEPYLDMDLHLCCMNCPHWETRDDDGVVTGTAAVDAVCRVDRLVSQIQALGAWMKDRW